MLNTHHVCPSALDIAQPSFYRPSSADHDRVKAVECINEAHHQETERAADPRDMVESQTQQNIVDDDEDPERLGEDARSKAMDSGKECSSYQYMGWQLVAHSGMRGTHLLEVTPLMAAEMDMPLPCFSLVAVLATSTVHEEATK